jgi:ribosomal subunit interface protein
MVSKHERDIHIEVISRHHQVSERTRSFALERAQKLARFNDRLSRIQVILEEEHAEFLVEMIAHVDTGATIVGKESGDGYRSALDALMLKMERQLKKDKEKRTNHKHETLKDQIPLAGAGEAEVEETYDDAVRQTLEG